MELAPLPLCPATPPLSHAEVELRLAVEPLRPPAGLLQGLELPLQGNPLLCSPLFLVKDALIILLFTGLTPRLHPLLVVLQASFESLVPEALLVVLGE